MKIAILADPLDNQSAGVHTYTRELVYALSKLESREHEFLIVREKVDPDLPLEQLAVKNIHLPIGYASLRLFFIIPYLLRSHNVDAVLEPAHFGPFNLSKSVKRITMIHDLTPILFPEHHRYHSQLLQKIFLKGILKRSNIVLSNSENTSKDIRRVYPFTKNKVKTILLGRDTSFERASSRTYHNEHNVNQPYFLCTGTIEPRKNLNLLLDAYQKFRDQSDGKTLLIFAGKLGWKTESFVSKLDNHPYKNDIILTGFISKTALIELYSHALALIYPSIYEGFGLPVLEAISCGTRVICSGNSSMPEVAGELGYYFEPTDMLALTQHMHTIAKNVITDEERKDLIQQSQKFSWDVSAQEFIEAIRNR